MSCLQLHLLKLRGLLWVSWHRPLSVGQWLLHQVIVSQQHFSVSLSIASGGGSGNPGQDIPIFLLNLVQKLYLTGNLAVSDMPDLYEEFSTQLSWAMFNFPSPFERFVSSNDKVSLSLAFSF